MPLGTGKIKTAPQGGTFMHVPRKPSKPKAGPVRLKWKGKLCGCTFTYKDGFVYHCKVHKARRKGAAVRRSEANKVRQVLRPAMKPTKKKKKFHADPPELV